MRRTLAQYLNGIKAIQELIGHAEDISRFDLIVTLIDSEVSSDVINSPVNATVEATFTPEQLRRLCKWAWSLKPEQIKFLDKTYLSCLKWTKTLQEMYHPSIPIFKAASGRILLARISAAIATLQFSWDGDKLIIEPAHVEAAVDLLRLLWDKPSFGYLEYSKQEQSREELKFVDELEKSVKKNIKRDTVGFVFEDLIHIAKFTRDELKSIAGMEMYQTDDLISQMLRSRVIRNETANVWEITKPGKRWMEQLSNNHHE
jgi:hypothetical protein